LEKFAADAVHGDAVVDFRDGCEKSDDLEMFLLEQGVQRHGAVFAAAPAEEDGFGCGHESFQFSDFRFWFSDFGSWFLVLG
jgi:hypothetical protein